MVVEERREPESAGPTASSDIDIMRPVASFQAVARGCTVTISVSDVPNGAETLWRKLRIDSSKFDGMVLGGPLEMQNPTQAYRLQSMHPEILKDIYELDWMEIHLPRELKEIVGGSGDVRVEQLWDNASGVRGALQQQRPTWLLVVTHGFLHPFKGYCALPSSFGGELKA
eukprot:1733973-Amphidinium_carterae.1